MPSIVSHINGKFRVIDIQQIVLITHKAPLNALLGSIVLESVKFVFDLIVDIFIFAFAFSAFGFDNPDLRKKSRQIRKNNPDRISYLNILF